MMEFYALSIADGGCFTLPPKTSHLASVICVGRGNDRTNSLNELAMTEEKDNRPRRQFRKAIECRLGSTKQCGKAFCSRTITV
jgi:hypothetical protein